MKPTFPRLVAICSVIGIGLVSGAATAAAIPGVTFKSADGGSAGCLKQHSFGGIRNDCSDAVMVVGSAVVPEGSHSTYVEMFGNSSWCQAVSTGGNANSASKPGSVVWTSSGPDAWSRLNTGDVFVYWNSTLVFQCLLESGGIIGSAVAN
jgi:hypothetical protein